jgi:3-deoxy-7-phosphoheptulonate synthase
MAIATRTVTGNEAGPRRAFDHDEIRALPAQQQPDWPDAGHLMRTQTRLRDREGIVTWDEVDELRTLLAGAANYEYSIMQAGDCAEDPRECSDPEFSAKLDMLDVLADVMRVGCKRPVLKVGRFAGQFSKPRSSPLETQDGVQLPSYRGPMVNSIDFSAESRTPDPDRMIVADDAARTAVGLLRDQGRGVGANNTQDRIWISHEALLLDYELSLVREGPEGHYLSSTHWPWIGDRTRKPDGAHVGFLASIGNPVACKVSANTSIAEIRDLCNRLDPDRVPGRLTLICRFGAGEVARLGPLVRAVVADGHRVLWMSDPMHGNTHTNETGLKVRYLDDVVTEIRQFIDVIGEEGGICAGLHLEVSPMDICECEGAGANPEPGPLYRTLCDPRLNLMQAVAATAYWHPSPASYSHPNHPLNGAPPAVLAAGGEK